jgi:hypothetical protein
MPAFCSSRVRIKAIRVTRLDECGNPVTGECSTVVSSGAVSVASSPQYLDPEEIQVRNGNGDLCVYDRGCSSFLRDDLTFVFCQVDPDLFGMITGDPVILDDAATPNSIGFAQTGDGICDTKFGLEIWSDIPNQACSATSPRRYGYDLLPLLGNPPWGDLTWPTDPASFTLNASTSAGGGWDVGPYDVINSGTPTPAPTPMLTPVGATEHWRSFETTLAPPTPSCGCVELPPAP